MIRLAVILTSIASTGTAADFEFCWIGNSGYALSGQLSVPDEALTRPLVTESDVTAFTMSGTRNGAPIGTWSLEDLTATTSWNLNFDPITMRFLTGGYSTTSNGQQWNASGSVNDCGTFGFGFNSGGGGQDVCVKNTYRTESIIDAATPFPVYPLGEGPSCSNAPLLGSLLQHDDRAS